MIDYGQAEAAGTGVVLTSNGEILTNNHVVDGATKITVTVVSTGQSYPATVVGTDADRRRRRAAAVRRVRAEHREAVLRRRVGRRRGHRGRQRRRHRWHPERRAPATVTALDQSITASDEAGSDPEQLTGMIQVDADIQAGDSGGPLYDSSGEVVGIDTAASSGQTASRGRLRDPDRQGDLDRRPDRVR